MWTLKTRKQTEVLSIEQSHFDNQRELSATFKCDQSSVLVGFMMKLFQTAPSTGDIGLELAPML